MWAFSNASTNLGASQITAPWKSQGRDGLIQMKLKFHHAFIPVINLPESSKHCLHKWIFKTCISCGLQQHFGPQGHYLWPVCIWNYPDYTNGTSGVGDKHQQSRRTSRRTSNPVPHCSGRLSQADRDQLSPISKQAGLALLQRSPSAIVQHRQDCPAWPSEGRGCFIYNMGGKNKVTELFFIWSEEEEKSSLICNIQSAFRVICFQREKRKCGSWASTMTESFSHMHRDFWSKIKFLMNQNQNSTMYTKQPHETRAEPGSQNWSLHSGAQGWRQEGPRGMLPVGQATEPSIHGKGDQAQQHEGRGQPWLGYAPVRLEMLVQGSLVKWGEWHRGVVHIPQSAITWPLHCGSSTGQGNDCLLHFFNPALHCYGFSHHSMRHCVSGRKQNVCLTQNELQGFKFTNKPLKKKKKSAFLVSPSNLFSHLCVDSQTKK